MVLMEALDHQINIDFTKANTKFCSSLQNNANKCYLFGNGKERNL